MLKTIIIRQIVTIACLAQSLALGESQKFVEKVQILPDTAKDYPFIRLENFERDDNVVKFTLPRENDFPPLLMIPGGMVCVSKGGIESKRVKDRIDWILSSFTAPFSEEEEVELTNPTGYFAIHDNTFVVLCYFCQRPDKTHSMNIMKLSGKLEINGKVYFFGQYPSSSDKVSWRRLKGPAIDELFKEINEAK